MQQQTIEQTKKKVDKTCRMCYHCRVRVGVNLNDVLSTVITPVSRKEGLIGICCRKGWWRGEIGLLQLQFNMNIVNRMNVMCPHFEGEDDEEDNSALAL